MDEVNWVEVLANPREVSARQRLTTDTLRVGRAWDNDLVLDDPHVAAHHLRLTRAADGRWSAEDLGSVNGLFIDGERARRARVDLDAATVLRIGTTRLRLRSSTQAVPAEQPLARGLPVWPLALGSLALACALAVLEQWLGEIAEPKLIRYLTPLFANLLVAAVWATLWSVLTRVFSGQMRFGRHLLVVGAGLLAYQLYDQAVGLGAFALSWTALAQTTAVAGWLVIAVVCYAHLRVLGPTRMPLKALSVLALAALGITIQNMSESEQRSNTGQPVTLQRLGPPSLRLVGVRAEPAFFDDAAALAAALDRARAEEPPAGDGEAGDD